MPRIEYARPSEEIEREVSARRGGALTPLDLLLGHNDGLARGWNSLLGAVRSEFALPGDIREMAILRVGHLNNAAYEWDAHLPVARREGLPEEIIAKLREDDGLTGREPHDAVLSFVDAMTRDVSVPDGIFEGLHRHFGDALIAELTATVAAYNMVSRFLVALDVQTSDRHVLPAPEPSREF
jgi:4-carboxymuconolactone decarboxylase